MMEYMYKVGDIFEYPETGEYEKLRGERIVVLEKGKGHNSGHTYIRALCFRPDVENDSFHFSCNDRYMDKILEHWRFAGHMDISLLVGGKEEKKKWEVTDEDLPDIIDSLEKAGMEVKVATDAAIDGLKVKCVGVDDDGVHITCTKEDIEQAQEVEKAWDKAADICRMRDEINSLKEENKKLKKEIEAMKEVLDHQEEKTYKLEEENAKLMQKISCADKLLTEAADRLYQGRAHLDIIAHN